MVPPVRVSHRLGTADTPIDHARSWIARTNDRSVTSVASSPEAPMTAPPVSR